MSSKKSDNREDRDYGRNDDRDDDRNKHDDHGSAVYGRDEHGHARDDDRDHGRDNDKHHDRDDDKHHDRDDDNHTPGATNGDDTLTGTARNDSIDGLDGNDTIFGLGGNDKIDGGKGDDTIDGGSGNDKIEGGKGDDTITGGAGNDKIDGGKGIDVAVFSGNFSDYQLTLSHDGGHHGDDDDDHSAMTVHDKRSGSPDGVDVLKNVERLRFADGEYRDGHFHPSNKPAVIGDPTLSALTEDVGVSGANLTAAGTISVTDADADESSFQTEVTAVGSVLGSLSLSANGNYVYSVANSAVQHLGAGEPKVDYFKITSFDGTTKVVSFTITGTNDTALIGTPSLSSVTEDATTLNLVATGTISISDADQDQGVFNAGVIAGNLGSLELEENGAYTYTVANDLVQHLGVGQSKVDSFTITSFDGTSKVVNFTIHGLNDAPQLTLAAATLANGTEDTSYVVSAANLLKGFTDADGNALSVSGVVANHGTVINNGNDTYTITPTANYNGPVTLNYTVSDGHGGNTGATLHFNLDAVNDAPVAIDDALTTTQNNAVKVAATQLTSNDTDVDGDSLTIVSVTDGAGGTAALNANGKVTFTPTTDFSGAGSFTYTVSDGHGGFSTATAYVSVTDGTNAPPLAVPDALTAIEDTAVSYTAAQLTGNDTDEGIVNPSTISISSVTSGANGTAVLNSSDGTVTFTPNANFNGTADFTYIVTDGVFTSAAAKVTVTVAPVNDAPVVVDDALTAIEDTPVTYTAAQLTGNDTDVDGDLLTISSVTSGTGGTAVLNSDGTVTFTPDANFSGDADFYYTMSDGTVTSAQATATVTVAEVNDAPAIYDLSGPLLFTVSTSAEPVLVDSTLRVVDVDNDQLASARVTITAGATANDVLSIDLVSAQAAGIAATYNATTGDWTFSGPAANITGNYNAGTGEFLFDGPASKAAYEAVLESVTFITTTAGSERTLSYTVNDGVTDSATVTTSNQLLENLFTTGFRIPGEYANDTSGFSVSGAGDINGDGFADVIVGAPFAGGGLVNEYGDPIQDGRSYVVFGKGTTFADGVVPLMSVGDSNYPGFKITGGALEGQQGFSVSAAGDVNGDGLGDLIIGVPYADPTGYAEYSGASYVVFGSTSFGSSVDLSSLAQSAGFRIVGGAANDHMGYSVQSAGDVNGDGFDDLIIGAPYVPAASPDGSDHYGASYVVYGKASGFGADLDLTALNTNGSEGFRLTGENPFDSLGTSVSAAGDINGDGFGDLIIGAPYAYDANTGDDLGGAAYVVFGSAAGFGGNELNLADLNAGTSSLGFRITGASAYDTAGYAVSSAGDVNGDGYADMIIGAPAYAKGTSGAAYVVFGRPTNDFPGAAGMSLSGLAGNGDGFAIIGENAGDRTGYAVSAAGDVNGDGYGDLLVGAPDAEVNGNVAGTTYVVFGKASGFHDLELATIGGSDGFRLSGVANGDDSGYAVSAAGDVNGDGFDDLIVGSQYASPGGVDRAGESYVIFGSKFVTGGETFVGTTGADDLIGTTANESFIAGQRDDHMYGNGGVDSFSGGQGDDTIHLGIADSFGAPGSEFVKIDGGSGFDTLALEGMGVTLDLTAAGADRIHGIERIDLSGSGDNTLILDIRDLLNLSDTSNTLQIGGNARDVVDVKVDQGTAWTDNGVQNIDGVDYHSYTQDMASLLVDPTVTVNFI